MKESVMRSYLNYVCSRRVLIFPGLFLVFVPLLISACSGDIGVSDVQFGTFSVSSSSVAFRAESTLSKEREPIFGWVFSMKNPPQELTIREIVEGPIGTKWESPPNSPEVQVTDGGRIAQVTKYISRPGSPFLFHHWSISNLDPVGRYKASLYIDGKLIRQVDFEVTN